MRKHITLLFLLAFVLSCTPKNEERKNSNLQLVKIDSVKLEQPDVLFGKFGEEMKVTEDGAYLLLAERIKNQVYVFNADGSFYKTIGERGRGPEGILKVYGFDVNSRKEILILDSKQWLLKVFDIEGNLIRSSSFFEEVPIQPSPGAILWHRDKFIVSILEKRFIQNPENSKLIAIVGDDGNPLKVLGKHDPFTAKDNQSSFFSAIALDKTTGKVYSNLRSSPYYQIHDLATGEKISYNGELNDGFKLLGKEIALHTPVNSKIKKLANTTGVPKIYLTDQFVIQHRQTLTSEWFKTAQYEDKRNSLAFYDKQTNEFIQETIVQGTPTAVHENKIYMIEDFNPNNYTIGIYELVERR